MIPPEPPQESLPEGELTLCELNADLRRDPLISISISFRFVLLSPSPSSSLCTVTMKGEDDSASLALYISAEAQQQSSLSITLPRPPLTFVRFVSLFVCLFGGGGAHRA